MGHVTHTIRTVILLWYRHIMPYRHAYTDIWSIHRHGLPIRVEQYIDLSFHDLYTAQTIYQQSALLPGNDQHPSFVFVMLANIISFHQTYMQLYHHFAMALSAATQAISYSECHRYISNGSCYASRRYQGYHPQIRTIHQFQMILWLPI